ncbi:hypothetical protein CI102_5353 [Trichoderma harzianum]|nr:hypothetical protein CI102_5353 [Trichoderma harzianum]
MANVASREVVRSSPLKKNSTRGYSDARIWGNVRDEKTSGDQEPEPNGSCTEYEYGLSPVGARTWYSVRPQARSPSTDDTGALFQLLSPKTHSGKPSEGLRLTLSLQALALSDGSPYCQGTGTKSGSQTSQRQCRTSRFCFFFGAHQPTDTLQCVEASLGPRLSHTTTASARLPTHTRIDQCKGNKAKWK